MQRYTYGYTYNRNNVFIMIRIDNEAIDVSLYYLMMTEINQDDKLLNS